MATYAEAINQALDHALGFDERVSLFGIEVTQGVFGTTTGLVDKYGDRVWDTPMSEAAVTGLAIGAAAMGKRPILVHQRMDFALLTMDMLVNWAACWRFNSGGKATLPLVVMMIVGKGWGQGAQHAKNLTPWFASIPGLRVAVPDTPFAAKGMLLESIAVDDPVIIVLRRELFGLDQECPECAYRCPIGGSSDFFMKSWGNGWPDSHVPASSHLEAEFYK